MVAEVVQEEEDLEEVGEATEEAEVVVAAACLEDVVGTEVVVGAVPWGEALLAAGEALVEVVDQWVVED